MAFQNRAGRVATGSDTALVHLLLAPSDRERARGLVEAAGLSFEDGADELVGVFEGGELVATGARQGDVLKMLAIEPSRQGGSLLGELVGDLAARARAAGHDGLFVFTRPESAPSFEALGFTLLASHGRAALLEHGDGLRRWLDARREAAPPGGAAAVVMNCNPFTLGHRHLVERAAERSGVLHLFVVREERSAFPFEVRRRLVLEGTRDLASVRVLDTGRYAVSALTFPSYFLRDGGARAEAQMGLDLALFGRHIAPSLGIRRRFFGSEPLCASTRAYNDAMRRLLPGFGVEPVEVPRLEAGGAPVSASRVREALRSGRLGEARDLVPEPTWRFLTSEEAGPVLARLRQEGRQA
jgi:[citrate (pro-3S)-lyase] ligase